MHDDVDILCCEIHYHSSVGISCIGRSQPGVLEVEAVIRQIKVENDTKRKAKLILDVTNFDENARNLAYRYRIPIDFKNWSR